MIPEKFPGSKKSGISWLALIFIFSSLSFISCKQKIPSYSREEPVGLRSDGTAILPINQVLTPYGYQIELPGMRPQAMSLSPDGERLVVSGKTSELVIIDPIDRKILQRLPFLAEDQIDPQPEVSSGQILYPDKEGQQSHNGLIFSPDGRNNFLSNVNGSIKILAFFTPTGLISPVFSDKKAC